MALSIRRSIHIRFAKTRNVSKSVEVRQRKPSSLENFVLRGNYPPHLLDALELLERPYGTDLQENFGLRLCNVFA